MTRRFDTHIAVAGTQTNEGQVRWAKGIDVGSATTVTLGSDGNYFDITGTNAITAINTLGVGTVVRLHFDGILVFTHHATNLINISGANITTAVGDHCELIEYAAGQWRMTAYSRADGTSLVGSGGLSDPMTTRGDIIVRDASNTTARLAVGDVGKYLRSDGTDVSHAELAIVDDPTPTLGGPLETDDNMVLWSGVATLTVDGDGDAAVAGGNYFAVDLSNSLETISGGHTDGGVFVVFKCKTKGSFVHSASLVLFNSLDIETAAGDMATFIETATNVWTLVSYQRIGASASGRRFAQYSFTSNSAVVTTATGAESLALPFISTGSETSVDGSLFSIASNIITVTEGVPIKIHWEASIVETDNGDSIGRCRPRIILWEDPATGTFVNTAIAAQAYIRDTNNSTCHLSGEFVTTPVANSRYVIYLTLPYADGTAGGVEVVALANRTRITFEEM